MRKELTITILAVLLTTATAMFSAAQTSIHELKVDYSKAVKPQPIEGFSAVSPKGVTMNVNSRYFLKDGKPWFPLMGEFHYWRYPAEFWEEEIQKMKAAGLQIVATYVYWGAHEMKKGEWSWKGRLDLRHFVELCQKNGMYVWLRPGPYINGDVRGRGFPDRIYTMSGKRSNKKAYIDEVAVYFNHVGEQTTGQYFSEGGPIIGVQLENEYASGDKTHIAKLKELAQAAGMKPVYWSVTANTLFQDDKFEVLPLQGAYCYRGWETDKKLTTDFLFAEDQWIMGADFGRLYYDVNKYPQVTCEQGGGMQETHAARFIVQPNIIEAHAMNQVGRGINMLGYFMFQGGTQYPGTEMPASDGPLMPSGLVSYDYQAPLDEFGRIADSYKALKLYHLFLSDFGSRLVQTAVYRPDNLPSSPDDLTTLRYTGRFNDSGSGFIFICNTQNYRAMTDKEVSLKLSLPSETIALPRKPVTIKDGKVAVWPVNFTYGGVSMKYATAQVLCKVDAAGEKHLFMYETKGIKPELCFRDGSVVKATSGTWTIDKDNGSTYAYPEQFPGTVRVQAADGSVLNITFLSREDAENSWKFAAGGAEYIAISKAALTFTEGKVTARQEGDAAISIKVFPKVGFTGVKPLKSNPEELFTKYSISVKAKKPMLKAVKVNDSTYTITAKSLLSGSVSDLFAHIDFKADMGTVTLNGRVVADRLYYGKEWVVGLKRFIPEMVKSGAPLVITAKGGGYTKAVNPVVKELKLIPEYSTNFYVIK